jgi:hypothetical protein
MRQLGLAGVVRGKLVKTTVSDKAVPCPRDHVDGAIGKTRQIGSPPCSSWCSSMKAIRSWTGSKLRHRKICAGLAQDFVGLAKFAYLALQFLDPPSFRCGQPAAQPLIALRLAPPGANVYRERQALTKCRSVSAVQPIFAAIDCSVAHSEA